MTSCNQRWGSSKTRAKERFTSRTTTTHWRSIALKAPDSKVVCVSNFPPKGSYDPAMFVEFAGDEDIREKFTNVPKRSHESKVERAREASAEMLLAAHPA